MQNFYSISKLIRVDCIEEDDRFVKTPFELIFEDVEQKDPLSPVCKQYHNFRMFPLRIQKEAEAIALLYLSMFESSDDDTKAGIALADTMRKLPSEHTTICVVANTKNTYSLDMCSLFVWQIEQIYMKEENVSGNTEKILPCTIQTFTEKNFVSFS